jgi:hypothetical protein
VHGNFLVTTDTEGTDGVSGLTYENSRLGLNLIIW